MKCKICSSKLSNIINFGRMPISNAFLRKPSKKEFVFTLSLAFCPKCYMVQLGEVPAPEAMFNKNYAFMSMTSSVMADHFQDVAKEIISKLKNKKNAFVVELGSNDGIMLRHIKKARIKHLGVEPAANVAKIAEDQGITVMRKFFSEKISGQIIKKYGHADAIFTANSLLSIEELNATFKGFAELLSDKGVLMFEDPYIYDIVKLASFDQIYDEHIYFFSGLSVQELAKRHGLQLVDMKHQNVHGGSMRYYLKKGTGHVLSARAKKFIAAEKRSRLNKVQGYHTFRDRVNKVCSDLKKTLLDLKKQGHRIVGYGATSKSTTLLNYIGIGPNVIDYISDTTPTKIGRLTPGTHIPVKSHDVFAKDKVAYALLFAWNHKKEIMAKEKIYRKKGGKFITYFPNVTIE